MYSNGVNFENKAEQSSGASEGRVTCDAELICSQEGNVVFTEGCLFMAQEHTHSSACFLILLLAAGRITLRRSQHHHQHNPPPLQRS